VSERRRTIAIVDDDPRLLESLENLFESVGLGARTFSSAKALIDAGLSNIDCIVTDVGMPAVDGFELHDLVKKVRPDLPVFLVTGRDVAGDRQRALISGIRGFFRKPFDGPSLLSAVESALNANKAR
jgi:FixJ family two-component response regulator